MQDKDRLQSATSNVGAGVVELWRVRDSHISLIGRYCTVSSARLRIKPAEAASWYLTSGCGRQYERFESGCN